MLDLSRFPGIVGGVSLGGYVLADVPSGTRAELVLIASGSEVHLVLDAQERLAREGVLARVVSIPVRLFHCDTFLFWLACDFVLKVWTEPCRHVRRMDSVGLVRMAQL